MNLSTIVPIYYNSDTLEIMYLVLKEKALDVLSFEYELIFLNDRSKDECLLLSEKELGS